MSALGRTVASLAGAAVHLAGWSLVHFVWQAALVGAVAWLALRLLRGQAPVLRYAVACGALTAMALLPPATAITLSEEEHATLPDGRSATGPAKSATLPEETGHPGLAARETGTAGEPAAGPRDPGTATDRRPERDLRPPDSGPADLGGERAGGVAAAAGRAAGLVSPALPWLLLGWGLCTLLLLVRLGGGWVLARRLVAGAKPAPGDWRDAAAAVAARVGVPPGRVRVAVSTELETPTVIGWRRPAVIVPHGLPDRLPARRAEAVLAHELAHVRRRDVAVNLLQSLVEAALFFHPAVWWVSSEIRRTREECCDEAAALACGDRRTYARELAELALLGTGRACPRPAVAAARGSLSDRIRRLLGEAPAPVDRSRALGATLALALVALPAAASLAPARAVTPTGPEPATAAAATPEAAATSEVGAPADVGVTPEAAAGPDVGATAEVGVTPEAAAGPARDTVLSPPDPGASLEARLRWALETAGRVGDRGFWIGWALSGPAGEGSFTVQSNSPGGPPRDRSAPTLGAVLARGQGVPDARPRAALLLGYRAPAERAEAAAWVRLRSADRPTALGTLPLLWLGGAPDAESVGLLERLLETSPSPAVRKELAAALSLHATPEPAVAAVGRLLERERDEEVRAEAVAWLGYHGDEAALSLLRRALEDPSPRVRDEAVSALRSLPGLPAARELSEEALESEHADVRNEAVQALADRPGDGRVVETLRRIAFRDPDPGVRMEAHDALRDRSGAAATDALLAVAREHPSAVLRAEAVQSLADRDGSGVATVLERIVFRDATPAVQLEAVDALREIGGREAVETLDRIARSHGDAEVRSEAAQAVARSGGSR